MIPRLAADWILPFIRTDSNRDFDSIMIPPSVAIEIENRGDFATFLGEEYSFLSSFGHIGLNHSWETYFSILRSDFAGHELLSSSLPLTDSMASLILFLSSMSDQSIL